MPSDTHCLGVVQQPIDGLARDARQRRHRFLALRAVEDEHRIDEIVGGKPRLAHHPAREVVATHPSLAPVGETFR